MTNGVPPHPKPWPTEPRYDSELLEYGDARNVADKYRYWTIGAIREDMQAGAATLEIAIENLERDFNMGTIVRSANAFNVSKVHIVGRRQWNKRGAMKTDTYLEIVYHDSPQDFAHAVAGKTIVAVDNMPGASSLHELELPQNAVLVFGSEGPGLSANMQALADMTVMIEQFGSTRSINVGVASGILMYKWVERHILLKK